MYTDLLTRIMNAERAKKEFVKIMYSNMHYAISELLAAHGYVASVAKKGRLPKRSIEIKLKYDREGRGMIRGVRFVSTPSLRRYAGYRELRPVRQGHGLAVVSTSKGLMTASEVRKQKLGGEVLFELW